MRFLLSIFLVMASPPVSIRVDPPAVQQNASAWVTCHVPRDQNNRRLTIGVDIIKKSIIDIDGGSPTIFKLLIPEIPCIGEIIAVCSLETTTKVFTARQNVEVVGCSR